MTDKDIRINVPKLQEKEDDGRLKQAVEQHMMHRETFEEAWQRVLAMKNTDTVQTQLLEVLEAMESGDIERDPERINKKFSKSEALEYYKRIEELKIEDELREMVENTPDNYHLILNEPALNRAVEILLQEDEVVFDVETTGVDIRKDYIVGNVLSAVKADLHFYIPTKHDRGKQLDHDLVMKTIKPIYENENIAKVAHNASFDIHMLLNEGIEVKGKLWDTQEMMRLLNENEMTYQLKPLVEKYLKIPSKTYGQLFGNKGFNEVGLDTALSYASKDGEVTYLLKEFQKKHLQEMPELYKYALEVEMPLIKNVVEMERVGYPIDMEFATEYADRLKNQIDSILSKVNSELTTAYNKVADEPKNVVNLNSPAQLKLAIESLTGRELENTNAKDTLKPLSKEFEVINDLLEYRKLQKLYSTYFGNLPNLVDPETGRIYTQFRPNGTVTGRFSSGGSGTFNMQNIPEEARKMFLAPDGYLIVGADFSAQEVRIIASESQEEVLLDAFKQGLDPYAVLASRFFNKPYEECYKEEDGTDTQERKMMKVVLLSSMYGASKWGLASSLNITPDEAEEFRVNFFKTYPKIDQFIKDTKRFVERTGFVWIGDKERKRRLPEARKRTAFGKYDPEKGRALRQAPNARIQGLAAIQTKRTFNLLADECKKRGWILYYTIHDEIAVLMPEGFTREDVDKFDEIMTQTYLLDGVENKTDIEIQKVWSDITKVDDYFEGGLTA